MDRLREVLQQSSIKKAKLSKRSGISPERLADLQAGQRATMKELRSIADALGLRIVDFRKVTHDDISAELLFRQASVGGQPIDDLVRSRLFRRIADPLSLMTTEDKTSPAWHAMFERGEGAPERNAHIFRSMFFDDDQLSPLLSLPRVVEEKMGVILLLDKYNKIDGASGYIHGLPFIILSWRFLPRMLFTLAHEIGHLIAHHDVFTSVAIIDQDVQLAAEIADNVSIEQEANTFASFLLMPTQAVGLALKSIREVAGTTDGELGDLEIHYLARIFGTSFWAAAIRCERLGLLPAGGANALNIELAERYGSAEKRAESASLPPRPEVHFPLVPERLLHSAVKQIETGEVSVGRAAEILHLGVADIVAAHAEN